MATLDFSYDSSTSDSHAPRVDLSALVDNGSLGTRTQDGLYEVRDWEFAQGGKNADDVIAEVLKKGGQEQKPASGSLGALGSIFARLTGSKVLSEEDLKPVLEAMKQHLMKKNVAKEISDKICEDVGQSLVGKKVGGFQSTPEHGFLFANSAVYLSVSQRPARPSGKLWEIPSRVSLRRRPPQIYCSQYARSCPARCPRPSSGSRTV